MNKRLVSATALMLIVACLLGVGAKIQRVDAGGTVYINPDGSVSGTDKIQRDGDVYIFLENISDSMMIEKDTIVIDGANHNLQGPETGTGINLTERTNVTIRNLEIRGFYYGVYASWCSDINISHNRIADNTRGLYFKNFSQSTITDNDLANNTYGIYLGDSSNNTLAQNSVVTCGDDGIYLDNSSYNVVVGNNVSANVDWGITLNRSSNNNLTQNNAADNNYGIFLTSTSDSNTVVGNNASGNNDGIILGGSSRNLLSGNILTQNHYGLMLKPAANNTLTGNIMNDNVNNFGVQGSSLSDFLNSVDTSNLADGKPVYYLVDQTDIAIESPTQVGYLVLVNCSNITVADVSLKSNLHGILLAFTNDSRITATNVTSNEYGMMLYFSSNNTITENDIGGNSYGMGVYSSSGNVIYHNNLVNNGNQIVTFGSVNIWDNGYPSGGNYWDSYKGTDFRMGLYQNETGGDGIGDAAYTMDLNSSDRYPLKGRIVHFDVGTWNGTKYRVEVVSDSTVSDFYFSPPEGAFIRFNVTSEEGTQGFCRVAIPRELLWVEDGWKVLVGTLETNYTLTAGQDFTHLYFNFSHHTGTVVIRGTGVVSEFQSVAILLLFATLMLVLTLAVRRKAAVLRCGE